MNDLNLLTAEELLEHIETCQTILRVKKKEKVDQLIEDLTSAAQKLLNECPNAKLKAEYYDEEREETIDVCIDLCYLIYEDNYKV